MNEITIHGFAVSPHVRAARAAFIEKRVTVAFQPMLPSEVSSDAYGLINPLRKMPALTHGAIALHETPALMSYADGIGTGPTLEPSTPLERARMWQFVGLAQNYLYPVGVMQHYLHSVLASKFGMEPDPAMAEAALGPTALHLDLIENALVDAVVTGGSLSHADIYCGVMVDYIARTRAGRALMAERPKAAAWLGQLRARDSFKATFADMLAGTDQP